VAPPARPVRAIVRRPPAPGPGGISLDVLAREAGVHPDVVRRLVALGLFDTVGGRGGVGMTFPRDAPRRLARAVRLRRDLGLDYAGALLADTLLDRIDRLEARLRYYESSNRPERR
jgi:MerR HTH family regulatory protein